MSAASEPDDVQRGPKHRLRVLERLRTRRPQHARGGRHVHHGDLAARRAPRDALLPAQPLGRGHLAGVRLPRGVAPARCGCVRAGGAQGEPARADRASGCRVAGADPGAGRLGQGGLPGRYDWRTAAEDGKEIIGRRSYVFDSYET